MFAGFGRFPGFSSHFEDFDSFSEFGRFSSRSGRSARTFKHYETLGVPRDATPNQIKKAFQQLAIRLHPDKGGDPEKFREIKEAYEVLKDPAKRRVYDTRGDADGDGDADMSAPATGTGTVDDLFDELMGMCGNRRARHGFTRNRSSAYKSKDMSHAIEVSLEDICNGATQHLSFTRKRSCLACKGTGFKGAIRQSCSECHGQGAKVFVRRLHQGLVQEMRQSCEVCGGSGLDSNPVHYCQLCCGAGELEEQKTLDVYIEQGMKENQKVTFSGEASCSNPLMQPGDVVVTVQSRAHPTFQRRNADLVHKRRIGLCESLCGVDFSLKHLDGRILRVQSSPGEILRPGQVKCLEGEGLPVHGQPRLKGNLYIQFEIDYPERICPRQQASLRTVLGGASSGSTCPESTETAPGMRDVFDLEAELTIRERYGRQTGAAYDSDDSDERQGPRRHVQCSQQ